MTRRAISIRRHYLWAIATGIEDGALSDAERRLREAQDALSEALRDGASETTNDTTNETTNESPKDGEGETDWAVRVAELEAERQGLGHELAAARAELEVLRAEAAAVRQAARDADEEVAATEDSADDRDERLARLESELAGAVAARDRALEVARDEAAEVAELRARLEELQVRRADAETDEDMRAAAATARLRVDQLRERDLARQTEMGRHSLFKLPDLADVTLEKRELVHLCPHRSLQSPYWIALDQMLKAFQGVEEFLAGHGKALADSGRLGCHVVGSACDDQVSPFVNPPREGRKGGDRLVVDDAQGGEDLELLDILGEVP